MAQMMATAWTGGAWERLDALVLADGSGAHRFALRLCAPVVRVGAVDTTGPTQRDLADALHALCAIHGTHPGLADEAATRSSDALAASWFDAVAVGLGFERQALARIVSAAGPLPSTPGQAATDAAFAAQRHAFQMLARSDRTGVATGAVAALAHDWSTVRAVLARAADVYGVDLPPLALPGAEATAKVVNQVGGGVAAERALLFGARALLDQHRAFWTLLEARAAAREA